DLAGVLGKQRAPEARCDKAAADQPKLPDVVLRERTIRRGFQRDPTLLRGLFAPTFDEPAELYLASLRRGSGTSGQRAVALYLRATRGMGSRSEKGDARPADFRQAGTWWCAAAVGS